MTIACLHTAASNIAIFDNAAHSLGMKNTALSHIVMPHLLAEAELTGGMTSQQQHKLEQLLHSLTPWFDAILITCSTLGPVADGFTAVGSACPVYRTDGMLADKVHSLSGKSLVLCAAESTLAATRALFCPATLPAEQHPDVQLIPGAWTAFKAGQQEAYLQLIAQAVKNGRQQGADYVALAQVSMAAATTLFTHDERPLTSPHLALQAVWSGD
ncbi:glutamate racemase [Pantoea sp. BIGb0393]|uniref:Glutamate racemase n=1 Tax=Pantoea nemavictus TaxID=2726955 RepID=A0ABU8PYV5_9GAMM|nr:glutamate racemase [Pantoea nemavictus]MBA0038279.1 glutamate racemase [Pantoea nemavictus]